MAIGKYAELRDKRVLVTGASAGIGKAAALAFDAQGAEVTIVARRKDRLDAVASQLKRGHVVVADVTQTVQCERAVAEAVEAMGGLDVLVNNGPAGDPNEIFANVVTPQGFDAAFKLHVTNVFATCQAAKAALVKARGAVINISSVAANLSADQPFMLPYSCAKSAQDMLTKSLARQWASDGVRVNTVKPGAIRTEGLFEMAKHMGAPSYDVFDAIVGPLHALGRTGEAEEVAAAIVFLASDAASFITGACVPVEGGVLVMGPAPPKPAPDGQ